jgi:hypothetical protein
MNKWNPDPVERLEDGTWIFWDETWVNWHGPFDNEEFCRKSLEEYGRTLFGDEEE